jgi:hypothetical protein
LGERQAAVDAGCGNTLAAKKEVSARLHGKFLAAFLLIATPAAAQFAPLPPLNLKEVDPALIGDLFGAWEIRDKSGKKRCRIVLKKEQAIGGYAIEVADSCKKTFPVMDEIAGWRLLESWTIDLIDATRKTRVRFETPDNRYVAIPEVDGINTLAKPPKKK